jgi:hypothetical protein
MSAHGPREKPIWKTAEGKPMGHYSGGREHERVAGGESPFPWLRA